MDKEKTFRKYLFEEMSPIEMDEFEILLDQDEALRQEFKIHQVMFEDRVARIKQTLPIKVDPSSGINRDKQKSTGLRWLAVLIAISLMAILGYYIYNNSKHVEPLPLTAQVEAHLKDIYTPPSVRMGEQSEGSEFWPQAIEAYRQQNYKSSIRQLLKISKRTEEQELYLGFSYLYNRPSNPQAALKIFDSIRLDLNNIAREEASWFSALIHLQLQNTEIARQILETIVKEDTWNAAAAVDLLKKI